MVVDKTGVYQEGQFHFEVKNRNSSRGFYVTNLEVKSTNLTKPQNTGGIINAGEITDVALLNSNSPQLVLFLSDSKGQIHLLEKTHPAQTLQATQELVSTDSKTSSEGILSLAAVTYNTLFFICRFMLLTQPNPK